jgi:hypothetical protein
MRRQPLTPTLSPQVRGEGAREKGLAVNPADNLPPIAIGAGCRHVTAQRNSVLQPWGAAMMTQAILIPVFVLVLVAFFMLYQGRDARSGAVDLRGFDQFDLLFCVLVALLIPTRHADLIMVVLAWAFAILRIVGAGLVARRNTAGWTRQSALVAYIVLFAMWLIYAIEILTGT